MMLQPRDARHPWQRMMVVLESPEIRIENELGETLASASDLPTLLDAVDGGLGEAWVRPAVSYAGIGQAEYVV